MPSKKEQNIKVRVVKKPADNKAKGTPQKLAVKSPATPVSQPGRVEEKKKTLIYISVAVVMIIIFIAWISLLGGNLSRQGKTNDNFWQRLFTNLKDDFQLIKEDFNQAKSPLNVNQPNTNESEFEKNIFPQVK